MPNSFLDDTWLIGGQSEASQSDTGVSSKKERNCSGPVLYMLYGGNQCWDSDPQDPHVFGLPDPDSLVRGTHPDPSLFS
jgi:hypothetical protein